MMNKSILKFISYSLFFLTLYLALSSKNMFIIWALIEVTLMSFIPLHNKNNISAYNSLMKYFFLQSIASSLFLMTILTQNMMKMDANKINLFICIIMAMKMGMFPFNSWYFQVTENMEWKIWFLINTFQKIIPIWVISNFCNSMMVYSMLVCNSMYSSMEMIYQNSIRWLLNSSSMNHVSWILMSLNMPSSNWELYMAIYIISSVSMLLLLGKSNNKTMMNTYNNSYEMKFLFCLNLMNFAGIPPMLGFLTKFIVLYSTNSMLLLTPLILNNVMMTLFYLHMMKNMVMNKTIMKIYPNKNFNMINMTMLIMVSMMSMIIFI